MINKKYFSSAAFSRNNSLWSGMTYAPIDFNFHLKEEMKSDSNPMKVNLGVGAYRDDNGHPFVLNSVKKAKRIILDQKFGHEESSPDGSVNFRNKALSLAFGP
jgi:aspartate aminotransferase